MPGRRCAERERPQAPGSARWAILALCAGLCAALAVLTVPGGAARAQDNMGLGPLSIRNQFPVTLGFLTYTPDAPATLPDATVQVRYQFALTNSFINTQSPRAESSTTITRTEVERGLTTADFPATGYGLYIDVETQRHLLRLDYGLSDSLEVGLELAWVTLDGGFLDSRIEGVERFFGGLNEDRTFSEQDRFDFYVARDGQFLRASSRPATGVAQDPVLNVKWNLSEGGAVLPALTLKLSYKRPLEAEPTDARRLVSSGGTDRGYYLLLAKKVGNVVGHFQFGTTYLEVEPNTFAERLTHHMFGLEFRWGPRNSLLLQSVTQSSIFRHSDDPASQDFAISRPTDVLGFGYKHQGDAFLFELGSLEDYNQQRNEADITFYFELGWRW